MDLKKLKRLKGWLEKKLSALGPVTSNNNPDEYSEANLSREILRYLKDCVDRDVAIEELDEAEKKRMIDNQTWYPDPMTTYYPQPYTHCVKHTSNTENVSICAVCKAKNPQATHCIHRLRY